MMAAHRSYAMALALAASALVGAAPNGNCLPRGECIPTYPKYPDQHTLCVALRRVGWRLGDKRLLVGCGSLCLMRAPGPRALPTRARLSPLLLRRPILQGRLARIMSATPR